MPIFPIRQFPSANSHPSSSLEQSPVD